MHDTAYVAAFCVAHIYGKQGATVVEVGGKNVNGSVKSFFTDLGMKYICVDIEEDPSVDIVMKPGDNLPFETGSVDMVISTSCFEHDPCFWLTFKEMCRITKLDGIIYANAPSNGYYHGYPGDGWRFYADAGQYLSFWASKSMGNEEVFPVKVLETFHVLPLQAPWTDWLCVWQRVNEKENDIKTRDTIVNESGPLENAITNNNVRIIKRMS
jgi:SAM-dependent methyltransferase